ncbi:glycosyl hydrolase [Arthrobacter sp. Leaf141]|uniref:glycoside hydrolase family 76 protein n=1 Tax=Micrococcaceae TaxID=1268 RepID=UPI0006F723CF|nr:MULTISPECIES: glycoside hydrolase family 76 protein [Micrococcaceae]KQR01941.1 glycosyl hydrolase [Arthrobacter sp. Leaf141]
MTTADDALPDWNQRATHAARSVTALFGRRLLHLPGTHLAAVSWSGLPDSRDTDGAAAQDGGAGQGPGPGSGALWRGLSGPARRLRGSLLDPWHYWWQAHYLDCLVDAGRQELAAGATPAARFNGPDHASAGKLASRLLRGIRLRNTFTFVNNYYDDMAWLALATLRLARLAEDTGKPGRRRYAGVRKSLSRQFDAACSDDLGGGVFWSKQRDFKNTPATAPVALFYARTGQPAKAQGLVDWLDGTLFDAGQSLYLDGARRGADGAVQVERNIYTYNQGPILGALLELGGTANLARAAVLIAAVDRVLTRTPAAPSGPDANHGTKVLRCDGAGDAGLFTGILCRYLALAATDGRLPGEARTTAARLVTDTAAAFWAGRSAVPGRGAAGHSTAGNGAAGHPGASVFSQHAAQPAADTYPPGTAVELSTQLQAWMVLAAAADVAAGS